MHVSNLFYFDPPYSMALRSVMCFFPRTGCFRNNEDVLDLSFLWGETMFKLQCRYPTLAAWLEAHLPL